jgi:hypothetical protein
MVETVLIVGLWIIGVAAVLGIAFLALVIYIILKNGIGVQ